MGRLRGDLPAPRLRGEVNRVEVLAQLGGVDFLEFCGGILEGLVEVNPRPELFVTETCAQLERERSTSPPARSCCHQPLGRTLRVESQQQPLQGVHSVLAALDEASLRERVRVGLRDEVGHVLQVFLREGPMARTSDNS